MATRDGIIPLFIEMNIVLVEVFAVCASWSFQDNHLETILEFITLKVNRVIDSMIKFLRGESMKYSERIRQLREDRDYSQAQIAALLSVGQRTYSDYERGKTRIPVDSLILLAREYNVSMDFICGVTDVPGKFPKK